jgi:hypothetical protein
VTSSARCWPRSGCWRTGRCGAMPLAATLHHDRVGRCPVGDDLHRCHLIELLESTVAINGTVYRLDLRRYSGTPPPNFRNLNKRAARRHADQHLDGQHLAGAPLVQTRWPMAPSAQETQTRSSSNRLVFQTVAGTPAPPAWPARPDQSQAAPACRRLPARLARPRA